MNAATRGGFQLHRSIEHCENGASAVDLFTSRLPGRRDDTGLFQPVHSAPGGGTGDAESLTDIADGLERALREQAQDRVEPTR